MAGIKEFQEIVRGSKEYKFNGTVLEVTGYYSGKRIAIDLGKITEEMLEELQPDEEDEEEWDE